MPFIDVWRERLLATEIRDNQNCYQFGNEPFLVLLVVQISQSDDHSGVPD
jgi:hypothetical protein